MGNGELDDEVDGWVARHPAAVAHLPYDEATARLVFAGCDAYVMPSRFEPSGLGQLYAMRYGVESHSVASKTAFTSTALPTIGTRTATMR